MSRLPRDGRSGNRGADGAAGGLPKVPGNRRRATRVKHQTIPPSSFHEKLTARGQIERDRHAAVDAGNPAAVDTRAVGSPLRNPAGFRTIAAASSPMEKEHFGQCLRRARESRDISLSDVAQRTKVSRSILELLERGDLGLLPPGVYSRGFIRSFARAVGSDEIEPLLLYERAVEARNAAESARFSTPVPDPTPEALSHPGVGEDETSTPRRGLGLAVFVIILLLIATITLSLLLRRPPPSGEGLSLEDARPASIASCVPRTGPAPAPHLG